jgi:hypothetical protein
VSIKGDAKLGVKWNATKRLSIFLGGISMHPFDIVRI